MGPFRNILNCQVVGRVNCIHAWEFGQDTECYQSNGKEQFRETGIFVQSGTRRQNEHSCPDRGKVFQTVSWTVVEESANAEENFVVVGQNQMMIVIELERSHS